MNRVRQDPRVATVEGRGFTLIELLVVIAIISVLAVALLPMIKYAFGASDIAVTDSRLKLLEQAIKEFQNEPGFGFYPPDDFSDPMQKLKLKVDTVNPGIESCLIHLLRDDFKGAKELEDQLTAWSGNTDGDKGNGVLGRLGTAEMLEMLDAWGNPMAYFTHHNYGKTQVYETTSGQQEVKAWKDKNGQYIRKRSYQLFSAGPDGVFGNDDDVGLPK
jgi:prepilin-type N-terminal cleavage/methylation domain-containing protein